LPLGWLFYRLHVAYSLCQQHKKQEIIERCASHDGDCAAVAVTKNLVLGAVHANRPSPEIWDLRKGNTRYQQRLSVPLVAVASHQKLTAVATVHFGKSRGVDFIMPGCPLLGPRQETMNSPL
jgi:hypothetical protein